MGKADRSDAMDVAFAECVASLGMQAANALTIKRIGAGKYEIDKRPVTLSMASTGVLVSEDQCATVGKPVPLKQYLHQASNVAKEMKDSPAKIDQRVRVTFDMDTTPDETDRRE